MGLIRLIPNWNEWRSSQRSTLAVGRNVKHRLDLVVLIRWRAGDMVGYLGSCSRTTALSAVSSGTRETSRLSGFGQVCVHTRRDSRVTKILVIGNSRIFTTSSTG